jgi:hypothetical protein
VSQAVHSLGLTPIFSTSATIVFEKMPVVCPYELDRDTAPMHEMAHLPPIDVASERKIWRQQSGST